MKNVFLALFGIVIMFCSCKSNTGLSTVYPKTGVIEIPSKGELRIWNDSSHTSFSVTLTNNSTNQSCEVYKVKDGKENWISPSLMAGKTMDVSVASNGHLYFKNFNNNVLKINYTIDD
jgi:hypothetical protein